MHQYRANRKLLLFDSSTAVIIRISSSFHFHFSLFQIPEMLIAFHLLFFARNDCDFSPNKRVCSDLLSYSFLKGIRHFEKRCNDGSCSLASMQCRQYLLSRVGLLHPAYFHFHKRRKKKETRDGPNCLTNGLINWSDADY